MLIFKREISPPLSAQAQQARKFIPVPRWNIMVLLCLESTITSVIKILVNVLSKPL